MTVNFAELKERVTIEQVADYLGIEGKQKGDQIRARCPVCEGKSDRNLVLTLSKQLWFCFECQKGGDCIALVAFVQGINTKAAAEELHKHFCRDGAPETTSLPSLAYLDPSHPSVSALGFPEEVANKLGIGHAGKGIMRGTVAVPLRDETGKLVGYMGLEHPVRLPKTWHL